MEPGHPTSPTGFAFRQLPWVVAGAALIIYLVTLNPWLSFASALPATQALGFDWWNFQLERPLFNLVTRPFRVLPLAWQIPALNGLAAVCAALTLAQLARSVMLLPQDRTHAQRLRNRHEQSLLDLPANWLAPVAAVMVCGLQLTFWEHATVATAEMFNLLLFATIVRALLEYRLSRREGWLHGAALLYGLALTNNWAMFGFLPVFLVALIWIQGRTFFNLRFLLRMTALGAIGLPAYLVNPVAQILDPVNQHSFWELLRWELVAQRDPLLMYPRSRALLLGLTSVLPLLLIGIRWASNFGDVSGFGVTLANFLFRLVHVVFLVVCVWVAFDPMFSPRELGYGLAMLPFYYLAALAIGYFIGHLQIVCGLEPEKKWNQSAGLARGVNRLTLAAVWLGAAATPVLLVSRNLPVIRTENAGVARQFALAVEQDLPAGPAILLGRNPVQLLLLEAHFRNRENPPMLVDQRWLAQPAFHARAARRYPGRWPDPGPIKGTPMASPPAVVAFLAQMSRANAVCSLEANYGELLRESVHARPRGLLYQFEPHADDQVFAPAVTAGQIAANQTRWQQIEERFPVRRDQPETRSASVATLGQIYSPALNHWGVELQRTGRLPEAAAAFELAHRFSTNNLCARINLEVNQALAAGTPVTSRRTGELQEALVRARTWAGLLRGFGPIDEPGVRLFFGQLLREKGMNRQALDEFNRAAQLNPTNLTARTLLAEAYLRSQLPGEAARILDAAEAEETLKPQLAGGAAEIQRLRGLIKFYSKDFPAAEAILTNTAARFPDNAKVQDSLAEIYLLGGRLTNALPVVLRQLEIDPANRRALLNLGALHTQMGNFSQALPPLDKLLQAETNHTGALLNRGMARMRLAKLDEAEADYRAALAETPGLYQAHFGLGEIALQRQATARAIEHFETGLKHAPPTAPERAVVEEKLKSIKRPTP